MPQMPAVLTQLAAPPAPAANARAAPAAPGLGALFAALFAETSPESAGGVAAVTDGEMPPDEAEADTSELLLPSAAEPPPSPPPTPSTAPIPPPIPAQMHAPEPLPDAVAVDPQGAPDLAPGWRVTVPVGPPEGIGPPPTPPAATQAAPPVLSQTPPAPAVAPPMAVSVVVVPSPPKAEAAQRPTDQRSDSADIGTPRIARGSSPEISAPPPHSHPIAAVVSHRPPNRGSDRSDEGPSPELALQLARGPQETAATPHRPQAATPLPPHPHEPVGRQIAAAIHSGGDGRVELRLSPEELGRVTMEIRHEGGVLQVNVVADRPETQDLLRRNIGQLGQDLRDLGYGNVSFSFGGEGARDRGRGGRPDLPPQAAPQAVLAVAAAASRGPAAGIAGGLDLRL